MANNTVTTRTTAKAWSPDISAFPAIDAVPEALVLQTSTVSGFIEGDAPVLRVAYVDDAAAQFTTEGDVIPEVNPALNEVLVATGKVTQLVRLSREQYSQPATADEISESVRRAVIKKADQAYLTQPAPTGQAIGPAAGLLNVPGITKGTPLNGNLDALIDLFATLEAGGASPSHIIIDPLGWGALRKFKTATGSAANLLGAGTSDSARMLLDVPVIVTNAMPTNTGLVSDRTAVVSAVGDVQVATSDDVYFASDSIGLRCTFRFGHNVVRPARIGSFTVGAS